MRSWQRRAAIIALVGAILPTSEGQATTAVVPDDYPTIQAALAAPDDTILVRSGVYQESLEIDRDVVLLSFHDWFPASFSPVVGRVHVHVTDPMRAVTVRGLRVTGQLSGDGFFNGVVTFETCRFDSGIVMLVGNATRFALRGSLVMGSVRAGSGYTEISHCTIIGGGIQLIQDWGGISIFDNLIQGPGTAGIDMPTDNGPTITDNVIDGFTSGIVLRIGYSGGNVSRNLIRNCSGAGITAGGGGLWQGTWAYNEIRKCGGHGMDLTKGMVTLTGNVIDSVGGVGIRFSNECYPRLVGNRITHTGSHGIFYSGFGFGRLTVRENTVLDAGGDGVSAGGLDSCFGNVIGRSGGRGLVAKMSVESRLRANTVFLSTGNGFELRGSTPGPTSHNISYGNSGCGLNWLGSGVPNLECNDWFANSGGAVCGTAIGASDLQVDPQFCNLPNADVTLAATSPLLAAAGCGLIGAKGAGCTAAVGVQPGPESVGPYLTALPSPSRGQVRFAWARVQGPVRLELFDLAGARRWMADADGVTGMRSWEGVDSEGHALPAGVYFARLTAGTRSTHARVILVR